MSVDLEAFKTNLGNVVRPNRFQVEIVPPDALDLSQFIKTDKLMVHVQTATIPDRSFNEIPIKYYGMELKIPAGEVLQDLVITFINDEDWELRSLFEYWAQTINDRSNSVKGYMREVFGGAYITVTQLDFSGEEIASYRYKHIFPKIVDQIELNMETTDTIETFNVTFAYAYWEPASGYEG